MPPPLFLISWRESVIQQMALQLEKLLNPEWLKAIGPVIEAQVRVRAIDGLSGD